jgi:hypothetical protein
MIYYMWGIEYNDRYDSYYFINDGEWVHETVCDGDENCEYCGDRPETAYTNLIQMPV